MLKLWFALHNMTLLLTLCTAALANTTWYVDGINGSNHNNCRSSQTACKTIGHAISLASSGDSIMVASATYTENLTIRISLKIIGAGATTTIIDGGGTNTVVAIPTSKAHVTLTKLTVRNGSAVNGAGIFNSGNLTLFRSSVTGNHAYNGCPKNRGCSAFGGGIYNNGTLTIDSTTIAGNSAAASCYPHCAFASGGGVFSRGAMSVIRSTISGNGASASGGGGGGGISSDGALSISNSTIVGNTEYAYDFCGAGGIGGSGTTTISNSTISGNKTNCEGGGISGTATLQNSIVANNVARAGGNCWGTMTSSGYNLSSDGTCTFNNTGDLNNTDPNIGTLGNYGGPTQTIPLLEGSPAIDAGNPNGCTDGNGHPLKTDQRGYPRPDKEDAGGCDMGAFERQKD